MNNEIQQKIVPDPSINYISIPDTYNLFNRLKCLITLTLVLGFSLWSLDTEGQIATPPPGTYPTQTMSLSGIPANLTVKESWRETTSTYYTYPQSFTIADFDALDLTFMTPSLSDDRVIRGSTPSDTLVYIRHVLDPGTQFNAQSLPYQLMVHQNDVVQYYNTSGQSLYSESIAIQEFVPEIDTTRGGPQPEVLTGGRLKYSIAPLEMTVDTQYGNIFVVENDDNGDWVTQRFTQWDTSDTLRSIPVYELQVQKQITPSEKCVFVVREQIVTEYYRANILILLNKPPSNSEQAQIGADLAVFPNPVGKELALNIPITELGQEVQLEIYSMKGERILSHSEPSNGVMRLQLPEMNSGMYIIQVKVGTKIHTTKMIKQ
ncbi:MAG: T9SS type A sorting domain-containing protein [Saprospiraceae bacterium]|nr:T9SS type A sorting domain-containing protein [Saprospiraceae bacterium]